MLSTNLPLSLPSLSETQEELMRMARERLAEALERRLDDKAWLVVREYGARVGDAPNDFYWTHEYRHGLLVVQVSFWGDRLPFAQVMRRVVRAWVSLERRAAEVRRYPGAWRLHPPEDAVPVLHLERWVGEGARQAKVFRPLSPDPGRWLYVPGIWEEELLRHWNTIVESINENRARRKEEALRALMARWLPAVQV